MNKKHYICIIKSHAEAPDWEQECDAESLSDAWEIFADMAHYSIQDIKPYVMEDSDLSEDQKADLRSMYQNEEN